METLTDSRARRLRAASSSTRCWTRLVGQLVAGIAEGREAGPGGGAAPDRSGAVLRRRGASGHAGRRAALRRRDCTVLPLHRLGSTARAVDLADYAASGRRTPEPAGERGVGSRRRASSRAATARWSTGSRPTNSRVRSTTSPTTSAGGRSCSGSISGGGSAVASETIRHAVRAPAPVGQAGGRLHGQHGSVGRLLDRAGRRSHRGAAGHAHRLDRRRCRQARPGGAWGKLGVNWAEITARRPMPTSGRSTSPTLRRAGRASTIWSAGSTIGSRAWSPRAAA